MKSSIHTLGEIAEITMGQSPPSKTYNTQKIGLPFFQGKAEFGEEHPIPVKWCSLPVRIAEAGDILLTVRAPVGPTNIASEKCCIGRGLASIRAKPEFALTRYLRFFFKYFEEEIASKGVGSTFAAINRNEIARLKITLPPLPEQERIVRLLDEAESLRATRLRANERMAQFVPALFSEFSKKQRTTEWKQYAFGDENIMKIIDGDRGKNYPKKTDFQKNEHCLFLNTSNVRQGEFDFLDCAFISYEKDNLLRNGKLRRDDLILTTRGTLGNSAHYSNEIPFENVRINSGMVILRANSKLLLSEYLLVILNSIEFKNQVSALTSGSAQPQLPVNKLSKIVFPLPPLALQREFASRVSAARAAQVAQEKSSEKIEALYQSMLSRAFAAEL